MKAVMSERLRAIIRDPRSNQELEIGLSKLGSNGSATSAIISIGSHQYKIQFVQVESASKK